MAATAKNSKPPFVLSYKDRENWLVFNQLFIMENKVIFLLGWVLQRNRETNEQGREGTGASKDGGMRWTLLP